MKVDKDLMMIRIITGSRLYGTDGPNSDYDYKAIVLPSLDSLLLNKKLTNRKERPEGVKSQDSMIAGGVETEYLPFQVFLDDFFKGQTYAVECAFAIKQGLHQSYCLRTGEENNVIKIVDTGLMTELIDKFLSKNVKKMMGYAVAQARVYGVKTERYSAIKSVVDTITQFTQSVGDGAIDKSIRTYPGLIARLELINYVHLIKIKAGDGTDKDIDAIEIANKQYPLDNKMSTVVKSLTGVLNAYGERVKTFEGQGADWKALSHALRITEQITELSTTGNLIFPRPNATFLKAVKAGEIDKDVALKALGESFEEASSAIDKSVLKDQTPELEEQFEQWKINTLRGYYQIA